MTCACVPGSFLVICTGRQPLYPDLAPASLNITLVSPDSDPGQEGGGLSTLTTVLVVLGCSFVALVVILTLIRYS